MIWCFGALVVWWFGCLVGASLVGFTPYVFRNLATLLRIAIGGGGVAEDSYWRLTGSLA